MCSNVHFFCFSIRPVPGGPWSNIWGKVCFTIIRSIIRMMSSCATSWSKDDGRYFSTQGKSPEDAPSLTIVTSIVDIPRCHKLTTKIWSNNCNGHTHSDETAARLADTVRKPAEVCNAQLQSASCVGGSVLIDLNWQTPGIPNCWESWRLGWTLVGEPNAKVATKLPIWSGAVHNE